MEFLIITQELSNLLKMFAWNNYEGDWLGFIEGKSCIGEGRLKVCSDF